MDILHVVDFCVFFLARMTIDLYHVKSEISMPFVFQDPVRAGP